MFIQAMFARENGAKGIKIEFPGAAATRGISVGVLIAKVVFAGYVPSLNVT